MISQGSRYTNSPIVTASVHGKSAQVIAETAPVPESVSFTVHVVTSSDTIEGLAQEYYSDPTLWWRIANANPEIMWWTELALGTRLRIPTTAAPVTT